MPSGDVYSIMVNNSNPGTDPVVELTAGSGYPLEIQRVTVTQRDVATSQQVGLQVARLNSASAGGTSYTPRLVHPGSPAASASSKTGMGTIGAKGDVLIYQGWNVLAGFYYYPTEDERIIVPRSGILAILFTATPAAANYQTTVIFKEL